MRGVQIQGAVFDILARTGEMSQSDWPAGLFGIMNIWDIIGNTTQLSRRKRCNMAAFLQAANGNRAEGCK